ncbi:hydroxyacid dehydrogenase [Oscillibacter sp.]|uniref:hydroxyacid dehydrogenase n=1 Tax=Oscillibacter sp. TaxID=1945593 RepID=UPI002D7FEB60|nr:hydroxyacid dehydrogenase [Oscillibacter sp.]
MELQKQRVYISEPIHPAASALLAERFEVVQGRDRRRLAEEAQGCAGILVRVAEITAEIMDAVPTLRVVAKHGVGVDNIDVAAATARGILVVNAPTANSNAVAEHTVTLILAACKRLTVLDQAVRRGAFSKRNQYTLTELRGKTVGLVGLGRIARLAARKLSGFDVELIGSDPFVSKEAAAAAGVELVTTEDLFQRADVVSLHAPLTAETHKMVDSHLLGLMKPSALLVNASRGPIVDEEALIRALREGRLGGAALDVFDPEPPKEDNPLFGMDNVVVSPHNAALTDQALVAMAMDSAGGILDFLTGGVPAYPVNREVLAEKGAAL